MRSLPPSLRDFLTGLVIVTVVLVVVEAVGAGGPREDRWVLLPLGAALFTLRQGVRRAVVRRSMPPGPDAADAAQQGAAAAPVTPAAPVRWQDDPVRVLALAALGVAALLALAFW